MYIFAGISTIPFFDMTLPDSLSQHFLSRFGQVPEYVFRSSGRINLLGEHTDYNEGFVLPAAIDLGVYLAISARPDRQCHLVAQDLSDSFQFDVDQFSKNTEHFWANYIMGVVAEIQKIVPPQRLRGFNLALSADLPAGGGMSSSAAIENGVGMALNTLFDLGLSRLELVRLSQRAENQFVGMNCGIMDMFASMMGQKDHFMRIDCRDLSYSYYPFHATDLRIILCDSGVKHALADSEYNTRRAECEEGAAYLRQFNPSVRSLRDVTPEILEAGRDGLRPVVFRRCRYVIGENARVIQVCEALQNDDFEQVGQLLFATHEGLSQEYEVSCPELDFLVGQARAQEGVLGARMMGGGFGGCTINLVRADRADRFIEAMAEAYYQRFGTAMKHYEVRPANGTELLN